MAARGDELVRQGEVDQAVITCTDFHFGRDWGYQHWPRLLGDLAGRLNESTSGTAS